MRIKFFLLAGSVLLSLACVALYLDYKFSTKPIMMEAEGGANAGAGTVTSANTADVSAGAVYALSKVDQFGKSQSFAQWSGKLLVINFWATWCAPCLEEMPMFAQMQQTHALNGLQIIGIAADNAANVQSFSAKMKIDYPLFADEAGAIGLSKRLGNRLGLLPHSIAIAPNGQIIFNKMGKVTEAELLALVQNFGIATKAKVP